MSEATTPTEFAEEELAAWRETLTDQLNELAPQDALKIAPELRDWMMGHPEGTVHLRLGYDLIEPLTPFRAAPLPTEFETEWRETMDRMQELVRAKEQNEPYDHEEYDQLRAELRRQRDRNDSIRFARHQDHRAHSKAIYRRSRDAAVKAVQLVEGLELERSRDGTLRAPVGPADLWAYATAEAIVQVARLPMVLRLREHLQYDAVPSLDYSRPAVKATAGVQAVAASGQDAVVAVFDTGVGPHVDVVPASSAVFRPNDDQAVGPDDIDVEGTHHGHGTLVAGIVASTDATYLGVAPSCTLLNARVWGISGGALIEPAWSEVQQAANWVDEYRDESNPDKLATVVYSVALGDEEAGVPPGSELDADADAVAVFNRLLWCNVVGNTATTDWVAAPGGAMNAIVASGILDEKPTNHKDFRWFERSRHWDGANPYVRKPDISAPAAHELKDPPPPPAPPETPFVGLTTPGVDPQGVYVSEGTSLSSPHVAGAAALVGAHPDFPDGDLPTSPLLAKTILIHTSDPPNDKMPNASNRPSPNNLTGYWRFQYGWGTLNAEEAVGTIDLTKRDNIWFGTAIRNGGAVTRYIRSQDTEKYTDVTLSWDRRLVGSTLIDISNLRLEVRFRDNPNIAWGDVDPWFSEDSGYNGRAYNTRMCRRVRVPPTLTQPFSFHSVKIDVTPAYIDAAHVDEPFVLVVDHPLETH